MVKVLKQVSYPSVFGKNELYNVVEVTETISVLKVEVTGIHRYWVPVAAELEDEDEYLEPLDDVDYNVRIDFALFRQKCGFLSPAQLKNNRTRLGLSLREVAIVLEMGIGTLSNIETEMTLQSYEQEIKLRQLENSETFLKLVETHSEIIRSRMTLAGLNTDKFFDKVTNVKNFGSPKPTKNY